MSNPLRQDPSRTTTLRRDFINRFERYFRQLRIAVVAKIDTGDALGLRLNQQDWAFQTNPQKLDSFKEWLQEQIDAGLLYTDEDGLPWLATFIGSAYRRGLMRAYIDARPEVLAANKEFWKGRQSEFMERTFNAPETVNKLRLLYTRDFEQLKGITTDMSGRMSRVLAQGLVDGENPRRLARKLVKEIEGMPKTRALRLARTEIIYAHAEGQLDSFEELGVEELGLMAEILTAGDELVCPVCIAAASRRYTIAEARGVIPLHPECRCCWVPWVPLPSRRR